MVVLAFEKKTEEKRLCVNCKHFMQSEMKRKKSWFLPDLSPPSLDRLYEPRCAKSAWTDPIDGHVSYSTAHDMRFGPMWSLREPECGVKGKLFEPKDGES